MITDGPMELGQALNRTWEENTLYYIMMHSFVDANIFSMKDVHT